MKKKDEESKVKKSDGFGCAVAALLTRVVFGTGFAGVFPKKDRRRAMGARISHRRANAMCVWLASTLFEMRGSAECVRSYEYGVGVAYGGVGAGYILYFLEKDRLVS
jgi:hypothetical protein